MRVSGFVEGGPALVLRAEGAVLLAVAVAAYAQLGLSWWLFAVLFLAPDIGMLGYLAGPRLGAVAYNAVHTTLAPALLGAVAWWMDSTSALGVAAIWAAHIGFDRVVGYGLKYASAFGDTHLGQKGRTAAA